MQRYDIPDISEIDALKDFLVNHGGLDYFDEIEATGVGGRRRKTTLKKNGAEITIEEDHNSNDLIVNDKEFPMCDSYAVCDIKYGYATDSAIVLVPQNTRNVVSYPLPIVICKTQKGYTCVFHPLYVSGDSASEKGYSESSDYTITRCYIIDDEGALTAWDTYHYQKNRNSQNILTTAPIPGRVDVAKDVYYTINRPFYQTRQPFMLDISDVSYASFAYNTILIKTS